MATILELLFFTFILFGDLISKEFIVKYLVDLPNQSAVILDGIYNFTYVKNYGATFGIFEGNSLFLIALTVVVCIVIIGFLGYKRDTNKLFRYSLLMCLGGALGNLYDRIIFGYVRDFIDYAFLDTFFGINFAIGNVADIFLLVGVLMFIVYLVFEFKESDISLKKKRKLDKKSS
ncbi:MAG: signal peptidase II [Clostridia bacterium]